MSDPAGQSAAAANLPSAGVRSLVSYLIFLHFFFLLVGIKSNTSSSGLDQDLRNKVPGLKQYLQLGAMDLSYMFHLTYYDGTNIQDTDHFIEADLKFADGSTKQLVFGGFDLFPGVRMRRYERFAARSAFYAESQNEGLMSLLPQAVARRIMLENPGCRELMLRVRRRLLVNRMLPTDTPDGRMAREREPTDPAFQQTVYEARALMNDEGEVIIAQVKAAHDTAAPQGTTTPSATPRPSGTASPTGPAPTGSAPQATGTPGPSAAGAAIPGTSPFAPLTLPASTAAPTATGGARP